ncbi:hypothetical protein ACQPXS_17445 [Streptomyces sp. CA-142005]|uniref:hypothetical protein n=1 Tax=Streptomyces sp. CA-142005 TaxID=3240052 RepID=UPI003D8C39E5
MGGEWYVLVETKKGDGDGWILKDKVHVEGGREQALARAEELSLTYTRGLYLSRSDHGRVVFRISETSWLAEITESLWSTSYEEAFTIMRYARLTVAQLISSREPPPVERPAPKKGRLRRALGRD